MKTFTVVLRDRTRFTIEKKTPAEARAWLKKHGHYVDGPKQLRHLYCEAEALPPPSGCRI